MALPPRLILGSTSKWRRQALSDAGYVFETAAPDVDEGPIFEVLAQHGAPAMEIAMAIAEAKAEALLERFAGEDVLLIAGDQLAEFRGLPRGKPKDADEARAFLRGYRGAEVAFVSALAVARVRQGLIVSGADVSVAAFADIPDEAIERAILHGDALRSCGAVVVEDPAVAPYVRMVRGTSDSVAGMPLVLLRDLLGPDARRFKA